MARGIPGVAGRAGSGSGLRVVETFSGATLAAARTARDNHFTANPTELTALNENTNLLIRLDETTGNTSVYEFRLNDNWVVADNVAQGEEGPPGPRGETFPSGQAEHEVLIATSATAEEWDLIDADNLDSATQRRLLPTSASDAQVMIYSTVTNSWSAEDIPEDAIVHATGSPITGTGASDAPLDISAATTSARGTMSSADKTKLDAIDASDSTPERSQRSTGTSGTSDDYSRSDHRHQSANAALDVREFANESQLNGLEQPNAAIYAGPLIARATGTFTTSKSTVESSERSIRTGDTFVWDTEGRESSAGHGGWRRISRADVQSDWDATSGDAEILNKPAEPSTTEADAGTATTARTWTAALVRRVANGAVNAIVPQRWRTFFAGDGSTLAPSENEIIRVGPSGVLEYGEITVNNMADVVVEERLLPTSPSDDQIARWDATLNSGRGGWAAEDLPTTGGGGLSTVSTDATITGTGTSGSPLSVANPFTDADETKLDGIDADASATFAGLTDTPATFTGQGSKYVAVNSGASALEFVDAPSGGGGTGWAVQATAPTSPDDGDGWYDTSTDELKIYDGTQWETVDRPALIRPNLTEIRDGTSTTIRGYAPADVNSQIADERDPDYDSSTDSTTGTRKVRLSAAEVATLVQQTQERSDWTETSTSSPAFIENKPTIPGLADGTPIPSTTATGTSGTATTASRSDHRHQAPAGGAGSGLTAVSVTAPLTGTGTTADRLDITNATTTADGAMSAADKLKLNGVATGAEVNVNADWNAVSGDAQILHKPTIPAASQVVPLAPGTAATGGSAQYSRADHRHPNGTFAGLTDTPATFTGQGSKYIAVNSGATALVFVDAPSDGGTGWDVQATAPTSPSDGDGWYDTTNDELKVYDGTTWEVVGPTDIVNASTTARGIVALATAAEALAGTDTERAVTPVALAGLRPNAAPLAAATAAVTGNSGRFADQAHVHPTSSAPPPAQNHNRYFAYSTDSTFAAAEFTDGTTGVTDTDDEIQLPASVPGSVYIAFAVPDNTGDITAITPRGGFNEFNEFQRVSGTITIGGSAYKVWRSDETWIGSAIQGTHWTIAQ